MGRFSATELDWREPALKAKYFECLGALETNATNLRQVVSRLAGLGTSRKTLVQWGVDFGYSRGYMRSLISSLLCSTGSRSRRPGAGRRVTAEVFEIVTLINEQYGWVRAPRLLRSASRVAAAQAKARLAQEVSSNSGPELINGDPETSSPPPLPASLAASAVRASHS